MTLFTERLVEDMQRLPEGQHTFLHQVCSPQGQRYRNALEALLQEVGGPLGERAGPLLTSLDNRRFFQGYAELAVATILSRGQYRIQEIQSPGPLLVARNPAGASLNLTVLSYIHKARPTPDRATVKRLVSTLDRVAGRRRMILAVLKRLPPDLDLEPIRRAVELWLSQVETGTWQGRYATYEDESVSLEFGLTGAKAHKGRRVVAQVGPFLSPASVAAVEGRSISELEHYRMGPTAGQPLVMACVADQPWRATPGHVRDFLYGHPSRTEMFRDGPEHLIEFEFDAEPAPSLFRDPLYRDLGAFLWIGRDPVDPTAVFVRCYINPWAASPIDATSFPTVPVLDLERREGSRVVLGWRRRSQVRVSLI